jgi:hypothetical protein
MEKRVKSIRRATGRLVAAAAITIAAIGASIVPAQADDSRQELPLEPAAWCVYQEYRTYAWQVKFLDWKVFPSGITGTPGQNDYKCLAKVSVTVPMPLKIQGEDNAAFNVPGLWTIALPIDWAAMCKEQYGDSANTQWVPGPATGASGSPWVCLGAPGRSYDAYQPYAADAPEDLRNSI